MSKLKSKRNILIWLIFSLIAAANGYAQTTEFTYQGKLSDTNGQAAAYDFDFRLCASEAASCSPPLATSSQNGVPVPSSGNFTVKLDFGAVNFNGAARYLEIAVRRTGETNYTTLAPRQKLMSAPYAIQALNTESFGNLGVSDFVQDNDPRVQANNYVQNTTTAQPSVNFNIGGTGAANVFNAATQFNLNGERILGGTAGTDNLFAGRNSGAANAGNSNSFFGTNSGRVNTASNNSFFGNGAGEINTSGASNSFFGGGAGASNTSGRLNSFFGGSAGLTNSQGDRNAFFGVQTGVLNSTGSNNTFLGYNAGTTNSTGGNNTLIGANTNVGANNLTFASAVGTGAFVTQSNSLVLGSINGVNGATADTRVGIGVTAPTARLQIAENSGNIFFGNGGCPQGFGAVAFNAPTGCTNYALTGGNGSTYLNRPTGGTLYFRENNGTDQMVIAPGGNVGIGNNQPTSKLDIAASDAIAMRGTDPFITFYDTSSSNRVSRIKNSNGNLLFYTNQSLSFAKLIIQDEDSVLYTDLSIFGTLEFISGSGGTNQICIFSVPGNRNQLAQCSSSLRYKTDVQPFAGGMEYINRLSPVTYKWKSDGSPDLGFIAERVAEVEPLLATYNQDGQIEGLKYDRLSTIFVNAFKEQQQQITNQQTEIERQQTANQNLQTQIERQQRELDELKRIVCALKSDVAICRQ